MYQHSRSKLVDSNIALPDTFLQTCTGFFGWKWWLATIHYSDRTADAILLAKQKSELFFFLENLSGMIEINFTGQCGHHEINPRCIRITVEVGINSRTGPEPFLFWAP